MHSDVRETVRSFLRESLFIRARDVRFCDPMPTLVFYGSISYEVRIFGGPRSEGSS
jgi:hypothetical protein